MKEELNKRTCSEGHSYYKSSDRPTCPVCEEAHKPREGFLSFISAPARRALENIKMSNLKTLPSFSEADILKLHGMGPASIPKLGRALKKEELSFRKN